MVVYVVVETMDAAPEAIEVEFNVVDCYEYNFDSATLEGWELADDCNASGYCWDIHDYNSSSGGYSINYGNGGSPPNYDAGIQNWGSILTPEFTVNPDTPTVTFQVWSQTEGSTYYDQVTIFYVRESFPDEVVWESATTESYNTNAWVERSFDLSAYGGSVGRLRFYFDTMDSVANDFEGYYFDDVSICCE